MTKRTPLIAAAVIFGLSATSAMAQETPTEISTVDIASMTSSITLDISNQLSVQIAEPSAPITSAVAHLEQTSYPRPVYVSNLSPEEAELTLPVEVAFIQD